MSEENSKDQLFYRLLCDLSQDLIDDTQSAADKTIELSSHFLGENSQHLVDDFRVLCGNNETDAQDSASDKAEVYAEQLNVVQLNMEQIASRNMAIRAEVNVVLSAMQFSELLRQHLDGMRLSFDVMINSEVQDISQLKLDMQKKMHAFDERKAFHEHIMHEQMPAEDQEITQDLIDQLIG